MQNPAQITKIEIQKKRKNRVSIYLNDEFAFGLDAAVVGQFGLRKGDLLTEEQISGLLFKEEKKRVKDKAFTYLTARAHSEQELTIKLQQKGFEPKLIAEVLVYLKEIGLVNDSAFAMSFARSRIMNRPVGEHLLRRELLHKGVNEKIVEKSLRQVYEEKSQKEIATELLRKRQPRYRELDAWKAKKKLGEFLLRRGFDWELVKEVFEDLEKHE